MTKIPSYHVENPSFEPSKPRKQNPRRGISLLSMIIFSIFTYILMFYIFNVSPSSIFKDSKILFFISNTLILIIAADYGSFDNDKEKHDLYREYANAKRSPVFVLMHHENPRMKNEEINILAEEATPRDILCTPSSHEKVPEKILTVVSENVTVETPNHLLTQNDRREKKPCDASDRPNPKPNHRSRPERARTRQKQEDVREEGYESDGSKWVIAEERSNTAMDRKWENVEEESEEFSKMSNEELNRRVEEFIQRFNQHMKLQSLQSR